MNDSKLIQVHRQTLTGRVYEALSLPATYIALSTKSILDERDTVPKTKWRIFNPGREYNGGILLYLPSARFHWQEPITNGEEYLASLDEMGVRYTARLEEISRYLSLTNNYDNAREKLNEELRELAIPAFEMGKLSDGITELPIYPGRYHQSVSNGQKLYHLMISYQPFSKRMGGFWSKLEYCQDHANLPTFNRGTKPSLADVVRGMVPQLEPAV